MHFPRIKRMALEDRGPLRVMFVISSMPVGGAETLLVNLVRRLDRDRFTPELCCLQSPGPLGEVLAKEIPTFSGLIHGKFDLLVLFRLKKLFRKRRVDAVITVGAGDKMFWGRFAARLAGVPVVCSAIHSTGWPDVIERPNRWRLLTSWTDAFIAVAGSHADYLIHREGFPADKVRVIPNGIDIQRFGEPRDAIAIRQSLGYEPTTPLVGIVAALRPEKNHELFLHTAVRILEKIPGARFLIIGDGPERAKLEQLAGKLEIRGAMQFLGNRDDVPELLAALDVFVLTSKMEANPVSILEAMACGKPVVAPRIGSIAESVSDGLTGFLTAPENELQAADKIIELLADPAAAVAMGRRGRLAVAERGTLESMVAGYERLVREIYQKKALNSGSATTDSLDSGEPTQVQTQASNGSTFK